VATQTITTNDHALIFAFSAFLGALETPRLKYETQSSLSSELSQKDITTVYTNDELDQNILLSIKMRHIQVLIPNENVLIGLHNIGVQKPLSIPPAAK
jgi:hypothetical protein